MYNYISSVIKTIKYKCFDPNTKTFYDIAFPTWNGYIEVWKDNEPQTEVIVLSPIADQEPILLPSIYYNNNEITCGDVYKLNVGKIDSFYGVIAFNNIFFNIKMETEYYGFHFDFCNKNMNEESRDDLSLWLKQREYKYLGNIYKNPELMEYLEKQNKE